jgi:hypothetical protein
MTTCVRNACVDLYGSVLDFQEFVGVTAFLRKRRGGVLALYSLCSFLSSILGLVKVKLDKV